VSEEEGDSAPGTMIRIAGKMELVEDPAVRDNLWKLNPWLLDTVGTPEEAKTIAVFRTANGRLNYWTWENNVDPAAWVDFP